VLASKCWVVVPAAGIGSRMRADLPKQYLKIGSRTVIEHSVNTLLAHPLIAGVVVALHIDDPYWPSIHWQHSKPLLTTQGGAERVDSVLNGLAAMREHVSNDSWILVHDAARPCVTSDDITRLIEQVTSANVCGGLLAMPVRDTMKRADSKRQVSQTVERNDLWHAQTPQMFRFFPLVEALQKALRDKVKVTDECSAFERMGQQPLLVECGAHNLKITHPEDLRTAQCYLQA